VFLYAKEQHFMLEGEGHMIATKDGSGMSVLGILDELLLRG
jgi:hypothetical protein